MPKRASAERLFEAHDMLNELSVNAGMASGAGSTAAEALRVIRAAKLHRHGPAAQSPAPALLNR